MTKDGPGNFEIYRTANSLQSKYMMLQAGDLTVTEGKVLMNVPSQIDGRVILNDDVDPADTIVALSLGDNSVSTGAYTIYAGNQLELLSATHSFTGSINSAGFNNTLERVGAVVMQEALTVLEVPATGLTLNAQLLQKDGDLRGAGELQVTTSGFIRWWDGMWSVRQITNEGLVWIQDLGMGVGKVWDATLLDNKGRTSLDNATIDLSLAANQTIIKNESGATFELGAGAIKRGLGSANGTFENSGTVDKVKGSAANTLDLTLQNKAGGKVNHNGGRINWDSMTTAGFYYLQGGTVAVAAGNTGVNEAGGIFTGGNSEVIADRFINAGTLFVNEDSYFGETGSDPLTLTVTGDFENSGTVSLEWRTTQTIDQIDVSGTAYLGGTLELSATPGMPYGPYVLLTYAARVGEFAAVTLDFNEYELDYDVTSAYVLHVGPPQDPGGA